MAMALSSCMDYSVIDVSYVNTFCEISSSNDACVPFSDFKCGLFLQMT